MNEKPNNGTPPREVTPDGFKVYCAYDEIVEIDSLKPNPRNPNRHPEAQVKMLARIIGEQGWRAPITVSRRSGYIVRGHARRLAGYEAGSQYAPIEWQDYDNDNAEMADLVADNRIAELAVLDQDAIAGILAELKENTDDLDPELSGFTTEQIEDMIAGSQPDREAEEQAARLTLGERFLIPPFTVLDSRGGVWAERKKAWKRLGIRSEVGRGDHRNAGNRRGSRPVRQHGPIKRNSRRRYRGRITAQEAREQSRALLFARKEERPWHTQDSGTPGKSCPVKQPGSMSAFAPTVICGIWRSRRSPATLSGRILPSAAVFAA